MSLSEVSAITDLVFLTGEEGVKDAAAMQMNKITHVLNLAEELTTLQYPPCVTSVRRVALRDTVDQALLPHLDDLTDHIHSVTTAGHRICVHCIYGVSRSTSAVVAYLVKHRAMPLRQAYDKVKAARPQVAPNVTFWAALTHWELKIRGNNSVDLDFYASDSDDDTDAV